MKEHETLSPTAAAAQALSAKAAKSRNQVVPEGSSNNNSSSSKRSPPRKSIFKPKKKLNLGIDVAYSSVKMMFQATKTRMKNFALSRSKTEEISLLGRFDIDGDGMIDYDEFAKYAILVVEKEIDPISAVELKFMQMIRRYIRVEHNLKESIQSFFAVLDPNRTGKITHEQFFKGLKNLGILHTNFEAHGKKFMFADKSLGLFGTDSKFRQKVVWLVEWKWFDRFILTCILLNSLCLAIYDHQDPGSVADLSGNFNRNWRNSVVENSEIGFTIIFLLESVLKIIAMGFYFGRGTYLTDGWNCLDFFVVSVGIIGVIPGVPKVSVLRTFRVLRPLRTLSSVPGMKMLVTALLTSIPALFNVMIILLFVFSVFGILGVLFWNGMLHYQCRITPEPDINGFWEAAPDGRVCGGTYTCPENQVCGSYYDPPPGTFANLSLENLPESVSYGFISFDHIGLATLAIFQCITMEGWSDVMYNIQDAHNWFFASVYFIVLTVFGSFFLLNLVFAVIWNKFSSSHKSGGDEDWMDMVLMLKNDEKRTVMLNNNNGSLRLRKGSSKKRKNSSLASNAGVIAAVKRFSKKNINVLKSIADSKIFSYTILTCIILNTLVLAMDEFPEDPEKVAMLEKFNYGLTVVFMFEMVCKLLGYGLKSYCSDVFNVFDALVVAISIAEIVIESLGSGDEEGSGLAALRTFRLFRVLKLARSWKSLRNLLATIAKSMGDVANFGMLLLLMMYIFSLVGMQFFANLYHFDSSGNVVPWEPHVYNYTSPMLHAPWTPERPYVIERSNFDDTLSAFTTIFQILSGEDWNKVMYNGIRAQGWPAAVFFVMIVIVGNLIVLNLFLAILLGNFAVDDDNSESDDMRETVQRIGRSIKRRTSLSVASSGSFLTGVPEGKDIEQEKIPPPKKWYKTTFEFICNSSLCVFSSDNSFRRVVRSVTQSRGFENAILILIGVSSVALALDNPFNDPSSSLAIFLSHLDLILTLLFTVEMVLKVITYGFVLNGPKSYLRDGWNVLDCFIVVLSLASLSMDDPNLKSIRSLRALRALRPLRLISRAPGMKRVVNSLLSSIPSIMNVMLVCSLFFLIFGIIGTVELKGKLFYCNMDNISADDQQLLENIYGFTSLSFKKLMPSSVCLEYGGSWENSPNNFDNVIKSMMTLFEMSTTEGWVEIMYRGIDATEIGFHPVQNWNRLYAFFFIGFIVVGSFFAMNLFVGAVIDNFNRMSEVDSSFLVTETQKEWIKIREMMHRARLTPIARPPNSVVGRFCYKVISHTYFEWAVALAVMLNTIIMGLRHFQQSDEMTTFLERANIVFWFVFLVEAMLKISVLRGGYFKDGGNLFDLLVVFGSSVSVVMSLFPGVSADFAPAANAARAFRMGLALKLMKKAKTMRNLFNTIMINLPALVNISAVMCLLLFVYAVMGVQLFSGIALQTSLNEHANFQTFGIAFVTLFRFTTGEAWNSVMYDLMLRPDETAEYMPLGTSCVEQPTYEQVATARAISGNPSLMIGCSPSIGATYAFFLSFTLVTTFVMLNLFVAVILEGFENQSEQEGAALSDSDFANLVSKWQVYDPDATYFLSLHQIRRLLKDLPTPLGVGADASNKAVEALLGILEINVINGRVHFADFTAGIAKRLLDEVALNRGEAALLMGTKDEMNKWNTKRQKATAKVDPGLQIHSASMRETIAITKIQSIIRQRRANELVKKRIEEEKDDLEVEDIE